MNRQVKIIALFLTALSLTLIGVKIIYGGQTVQPEYSRHLWNIHIMMNIAGEKDRAKVRLTLPRDTDRQRIYNEHFENNDLVFYIRERAITGNRLGFWRSEALEGSRTLQYAFSAQLKSLLYNIPTHLRLPKRPLKEYPPALHTWLDASRFIQSESSLMKQQLRKTIGRERNLRKVIQKIYNFVRGEVEYRSEKGSKSAKRTLEKLVADCGGQARLFAALSRTSGIPSRIVGGLILSGGVKNTTHVWVENYIEGQWVPFDVVNNHYATIPSHYLELYRGDYVLVKHLGLSQFEYFFSVRPERIPPLDNPWSLYVLPIRFQSFVKILLLIPVGALVVAFFRSVIGIQTLGTFTPILLALAFREISLTIGLLCLFIMITLGWAVRTLLDRLKILVIPRLSILVTMVIIMTLSFMIVGFHLGQQRMLYISFFPMVIMTWIIERFSILQIEDGTKEALKVSLGTMVVAVAAYYVMGLYVLRTYLFAFPELLLIIMALLLLLGRYTGIRVIELWRFREFNKLQDKIRNRLSAS